MKKTVQAAPRRAGWPGRQARQTQASRTTTPTSASPLVIRWENSISVATPGSRGIITPLQSGQCSPQPAPDPLARTYAPQRITATL